MTAENPSSSFETQFVNHDFLLWWPHISAVLLVIVELCWILLWFQMVMQITQTAPLWTSAVVMGGIMLAAYGLGTMMESLRLLRRVQLALLGALLAASLILAENWLLKTPIRQVTSGLVGLDPGAVLVLFFVIWLWWRGVSLSRGAIRPMVAWRRFELGLLFFMGYILIAAQSGFFVPGIGVSILFIFSGLLAVVFARVSYVGIRRGVLKNPFDLRWSISVSWILGGVVVLAAIIGSLLSGQYRRLLDFLSETIKFLIALGIFVLSIPGLLFSYLLGPIMPWLKLRLIAPQATETPEYPIGGAFPQMDPANQPPGLPVALQVLCFWGLVLILVFLLIMRIRKTLQTRHQIDFEKPKSLLHEGEARILLRAALLDALDGIVGRLRPAQRALAAARIRRIYAQLMGLCADLELSQAASTDPLRIPA